MDINEVIGKNPNALPATSDIFLFGPKLEGIARLKYFYIFFGMLNTFYVCIE